ncbi:MAG: M3 family oligoendopeptidase [Aurantimonas endophytica]|uniref:Oligoendopeptidase F n=1 Tax=Aurantimonas endophytica TaxID=1522175 RepID=A0A7W6MQD5_9HYPH|nr:M3 family oligoendopeptidase [Aurantimonas endophytica]MBB4003945.1 oligoendopeptidase F [Aurantimonas endophytica]MCO6404795.1 M3 family oligoendopeptidase [Aurantimonas endophytica]
MNLPFRPTFSAVEAAGGDAAALPEWNLADLYPSMDSQELADDLAEARRLAEAFQTRWRGTLTQAATTGEPSLAEAVVAFEALEELLGRIISYAGLIYSGDTSDPARAKFYGDIQSAVTDISSRLLFFPLELNRIDDAVVDAAMARDPALAHYRPWLVDLRQDKPFQLEDRVEELFHEKAITGRGAWNRLFDETLTSLRFTVDGDDLALEATLNLLQDPDGEKRRKAASALANVFSENLRTFTLITNTLAKDKEISDRWRGFEDVADSRHLANRVEREVVDALEKAVSDAYPSISHRYYAMKAKWLGLDVLDFWDRNAPLPDARRRDISWDEARETVLSAYSGFSPEMAAIAEPFFKNGWIDAAIRPGKSPGAFAHPTVPSVHPYVLLNYMGKPRDVMTLAHELGHGVHQVLAGRQGALMAATPLTLAETASVFGEMLTFRSLLDQTKTKAERKTLLASKVEDMINTVVRQIAFYQFERALHEERRQGELTTERIGEIWMDVQARSLGPSLRLGDGYETYWTYVPHFIHSPFYVYAYAFGDCLVNSLYAVYENSESGFQEKYFAMLKAGGTKHHSELLKPFGLDASDPAFWSRGLAMISGFIDELEAMED